ncbi:cobalt transporter CbiM [Desulfotignum phosphitoxidans]|jgi:cobalt/nickel transport system permease protein|uniref:Cobalt/nickel transport system permease protein CbiM n=1 Tax=Desulfotignum phosphitoxidans DSM 13687 TaxID=1286635 RepID=S0G3N3_9BACT|nr:cobalt transporter CbiM [Desulfotignum phosphitoxidans]EMS81520.1 cobalt/nickel transport system permease protein CbiM [Desulfotignum phosphitoxidans DSM 13687]
MHISDGVLPVAVTIGGYAVSAGLAAWSARRIHNRDLPKVAVITSAFFVASLVHIPFGPTSAHLLLPGLAGALLGPAAFLAIGLALLLQSLLFQFGGLTALGANALMMGIPAMICGWFFQTFKGSTLKRQTIVGAVAGAMGTVMAAAGLALMLMTGGEDFFGVAKIALAAHVPVIVIEGVMSGFTIGFLARVQPALLEPLFHKTAASAHD